MIDLLELEKLKKWLLQRKGRIALMASMLKMKRVKFHTLVFFNRVSDNLLDVALRKKYQIEHLETDCLKKHKKLKNFVYKGNGRITRLANELGVSTTQLRRFAKAVGDSRYLLLNLDLDMMEKKIQEIDREYKKNNYDLKNFNIFLTEKAKKKTYKFSEVEDLVEQLKDKSNYADHESAVIFTEVDEGVYQILGIGFDLYADGTSKKHMCDDRNCYFHAITVAILSMNKNSSHALQVLSTVGPCIKCAKRLAKLSIKAVYYYLDPVLKDGIDFLTENNITVKTIAKNNTEIIEMNNSSYLKA